MPVPLARRGPPPAASPVARPAGAGSRGRATPPAADPAHVCGWARAARLVRYVFLAVVDNTIVNVALPFGSAGSKPPAATTQRPASGSSTLTRSLRVAAAGGGQPAAMGRPKGALQVGPMVFARSRPSPGFRAARGRANRWRVPPDPAGRGPQFPGRPPGASPAQPAPSPTPGQSRGGRRVDRDHRPRRGSPPDHRRPAVDHSSRTRSSSATIPIALVLAPAPGARSARPAVTPAAPRLDLLVSSGPSLGWRGKPAHTTQSKGTVAWLVGSSYDLSRPRCLAQFAPLAVFAVWQRRTGEPMLHVTLFRNIRFSAASFSIAVAFFSLFGFEVLHHLSILRFRTAPLATPPRRPACARSPSPSRSACVLGAWSPAGRLGTEIVVPACLILMGVGFFIALTLAATARNSRSGPGLHGVDGGRVGLGHRAVNRRHPRGAPAGQGGGRLSVNHVTRELWAEPSGWPWSGLASARSTAAAGPAPARRGYAGESPGSARQSPAAALQVATQAPGSAPAVIIEAATRAFVAGLNLGSLVGAGVVALGAVFAFLVLLRRSPAPGRAAS